MKCTKIIYKRVFALPDYQNMSVGVELEVEEGETAKEVLEAAKKFVNDSNPNDAKKTAYEHALRVVETKDGRDYRVVMDAQKLIKDYESEIEDFLPF